MAPKLSTAYHDPKEHTRNDQVLIAVMGTTGSGKSTFINLASGSRLPVAAGLASCTQEVVLSPEFSLDGHTIRLIDTPGFDNTDRSKSEVDILKEIAGFLERQYGNYNILQGVIYMHRITDIGMGGISTRSFNLFRKLCGETTLVNVIIVTSMWDRLDIKEAEGRELELITEGKFFKPALDNGAKTARHDNTRKSTQDIIRTCFPNTRTPLDIQRELVDQHINIYDMQAGREVDKNFRGLLQEANKELESPRVAGMQQLKEGDRKEPQREINELKEEITRYERDFESLLSPDRTKPQERENELNYRRSKLEEKAKDECSANKELFTEQSSVLAPWQTPIAYQRLPNADGAIYEAGGGVPGVVANCSKRNAAPMVEVSGALAQQYHIRAPPSPSVTSCKCCSCWNNWPKWAGALHGMSEFGQLLTRIWAKTLVRLKPQCSHSSTSGKLGST